MNVAAAALTLPLGVLFVWAGAAKAASDPQVERLALTRLLHRKRAAATTLRVVGTLELGIGAVLVLVPAWTWPRWAALGLALGGLAYTAVALRLAPGSDCGCFGTTDSRRISGASIARGAVVALAAGATTTTSAGWLMAFSEDPALAAVAAVAGAAGLAGLYWEEVKSLELWTRLRAGGPRAQAHDCATAAIAPAVAIERLRSSDAWIALRPYVTDEDPVDQWREHCLRFVCFPARHEDRPATAVFAVSLSADVAHCKGAVVVDDTDELVAHIGAPLVVPGEPAREPAVSASPVIVPRLAGGSTK